MKLKEKNEFKKSKVAIPSIILYVFGILFACATILALYNTSVYIQGLTAQGLVIKDALMDVINFYIKECSTYVAFTVIFAVGGILVQRVYDCKKLIGELEVSEIEEEAVYASNFENSVDETSKEELKEEIVEESSEEK